MGGGHGQGERLKLLFSMQHKENAHYKENKQSTRCSIGRSINQTCNSCQHGYHAAYCPRQTCINIHRHSQLQFSLSLVSVPCYQGIKSCNKTQHVKRDRFMVRNAVNLVSGHIVTGYMSLFQTNIHSQTAKNDLYTLWWKVLCFLFMLLYVSGFM